MWRISPVLRRTACTDSPAKQTSQLAPMARKKICCHPGSTTFIVAKLIVSCEYADISKTPPSVPGSAVTKRHLECHLHPNMIVTKKSMPAKFPRKEITQFLSRSRIVIRRWRKATVINMTLLVNRSAPESTIMTKPTGKNTAPIVRMRPGSVQNIIH